MKTKILFFLFVFLIAYNVLSYAQFDGNKTYNQSELSFDTIQGYDIVSMNECSYTDEIGSPQLPVLIFKYLLPVNAEVTGLTINNLTYETLVGSYIIYPVQPAYLPNGMEEPDFVMPDSTIYNSSEPYPGKQIEIIDDGFMMSYHIVTIKMYPLEYVPDQQQLKLYSSIDFTIDYTLGECQIQIPQRISQYRNDITEGFIKSQVDNNQDFGTTSGGALNVVTNNVGDKSLSMDFTPSLDGDIPDYIIITNELLKPEFEVLAQWKTKKGIPTLVVTTEDICNEYNGVDKAEQIRKYLIDAYINWGPSLFVLLGGDVAIIPGRYGYDFGSEGLKVTDLYYATVEGNWNANENYLWGEGTVSNNIDQFDTSPDFFLGRAPVDNVLQAENFIDKVISYEKLNNIGENYDYLLNYLTTNFEIYRHYFQKYIWVNDMNQQTNPWFQLKHCCPPIDTSSLYSLYMAGVVEELTHQNFLTALNNGGNSNYGFFHFVLHSDHSGPTGLGAKNSDITINEVNDLVNAPYQQVMISTGCDPNEFQYEDCIAEYYINAEGGGVAFLGYTSPGSEGFLYSPRIYFNSLFNMQELEGFKNGIASTNAKLSKSHTALRGLNLLGDPEMPVWTKIPNENGAIAISDPPTLHTGNNSFSLLISNAEPELKYNICFYKENANGQIEVFQAQKVKTDIGSQINVDFEFIIDTPGDIYLTVSAHNYIPVEKIYIVECNENIHVFTSDFATFDNGYNGSIGNNDLQPDAGETINFAIALTNTGLLNATSVTAEFNPNKSKILNESFEGVFPPLFWNVNSGQIDWFKDEETSNPLGFNPADGLSISYCNTSQGDIGDAARLVTNEIYLNNSVLKFSMFHVSEITAIHSLKVQICLDGNSWIDIPGAQYTVYNATVNEDWQNYELNLDGFNGNYAQIGFLATSEANNIIYDVNIDKISLESEYVIVDSPTCIYNYGTIAGQGGSGQQNGCLFTIDPNTPNQVIVPFTIDITADNGYTETDYIFTQIAAQVINIDHIEFFSGDDQDIDPNEVINIYITLVNDGNAEAISVNSNLSIIEPLGTVSITNGVYNFENISPNSLVTNSMAFSLQTASTYDPGDEIILNLELTDVFGKVIDHEINLSLPNYLPDWEINYNSYENSIFFYWNPKMENGGYNIYRKFDAEFAKLNDKIITSSTIFLDEDPILQPLTEYDYKITLVTPTGLECYPIEFQAWTSLPMHEGWPITIPEIEFGELIQGSANTEDINNDGTQEIFLNIGSSGGLKANILGFYHDGTEIYEGLFPLEINGLVNFQNFDLLPNTTTNKCNIATSPAIADFDNDEIVDLIVNTNDQPPEEVSSTAKRLYRFGVFENSEPNLFSDWDNIEVNNVKRSPIITDIDSDGNLEVITRNNNSINITTENGGSYSNWPVSLPYADGGYGMVVSADLDYDSNEEIIFGIGYYGSSEGGIYIFNNNGDPYVEGSNGLFYTNDEMSPESFHCSPIVANFDNSGTKEIIGLSRPNPIEVGDLRVFILKSEYVSGPEQFIEGWGFNDHIYTCDNNYWYIPIPAVGDIDNDDELEIVFGFNSKLVVLDNDGSTIFNIDVPGLRCDYSSPLICDIDIDSDLEIIVATETEIFAFDIDGQKLDGYPINLPFKSKIVPCISDIDFDGKNEIIASCRNQIYVWDTEGDADRIEWGMYRHDSYNSGVYDNNTCRFYSGLDIIEEGQSITWDNKRQLKNVRVENGGTLTITGKVAMPEGSKIVVERGGLLIIDGGTLTNACKGMWQGIELQGNANAQQSTDYQGEVRIINGGTIENAVCGIQTIRYSMPEGGGEAPDYNYTGGIILADDAIFKNNNIAVKFWPYTYAPSNSLFRNCQFITDNDLLSDADPDYFIKISNITSIDIAGCTLTDQHSYTNLNELTSGIESFNANYSLFSYGSLPNVFTGLYDGIRAYSSNPDITVSIKDCEFAGNLRSVYLKTLKEAIVTGNTFNPWDEDVQGENSYCLYLDYCTDYTIEENTFMYEGANTGPIGIGLVINNSGPYNNEIYRNNFTNLEYATLAQNCNRSSDPDIGLTIKCNDYWENFQDIAVTTWEEVEYPGIARNQGAAGGSTADQAGNLFSQNNNGNDISDYSTIKEGPITYYHHDPEGQPRVVPIYHSKGITLDPQSNPYSAESCPPNETGGGGGTGEEELRGSMAESEFKADSTQAILTALVDGGNTEVLEQEVLQSMPPETYDIYMSLMGKSPYLSDSVLIAAIEKENVLPNVLIKDILVANPQAAKSNEVMEKVDEKSVPFDEQLLAEVLLGQYIVAAKERLEATVSYYRHKRSTDLKLLKQLYRNDTVNTWAHDSLISLLERESGLNEKYELVFEYISMENWTAANNLMNTLPSIYTMNLQEQEIYQEMQQLTGVLLNLFQLDSTIYNMPDAQKAILYGLADNSQNFPGALARNILIEVDRYEYQEPVILPEASLKSGNIVFDLPGNKTFTPEYVKIYPNPALDYIIIELNTGNATGATISLFDSKGKQLRSVNVPAQKQDYVLGLKDVPTGVYIVKVDCDGKNLGGKKFTIVK